MVCIIGTSSLGLIVRSGIFPDFYIISAIESLAFNLADVFLVAFQINEVRNFFLPRALLVDF